MRELVKQAKRLGEEQKTDVFGSNESSSDDKKSKEPKQTRNRKSKGIKRELEDEALEHDDPKKP